MKEIFFYFWLLRYISTSLFWLWNSREYVCESSTWCHSEMRGWHQGILSSSLVSLFPFYKITYVTWAFISELIRIIESSSLHCVTCEEIKHNDVHFLGKFKKFATESHTVSNPICLKTDLFCYVMPASVFDKRPHHLLKHYDEEIKHIHSLQSCCMVHKMYNKHCTTYTVPAGMWDNHIVKSKPKWQQSHKIEHVPAEVLIWGVSQGINLSSPWHVRHLFLLWWMYFKSP